MITPSFLSTARSSVEAFLRAILCSTERPGLMVARYLLE